MFIRCLAYTLAFAAPMALGYGCKGGDGEQPGSGFATVVETAPSDAQTEVPVATRIGCRMSANIDATTLTNQTFFLTDEEGSVVPATVLIGEEPDTAELDPDEPLSVITNYAVTVTTGVRAGGTTLEEDFVWRFKTLDSEWGEAEWVESIDTGSSSRQEIAVDRQLNAIAVWQYEDAGGTTIWANRYTRSDLWGAPQPIDDQSGGATSPALAVDGTGNGFVVWERSEDGGATKNIWTNRYDLEGGWGAAELLQSGEIESARTPAVAADLEGNAIAVWAQRNVVENQEVVWASRFDKDTGWDTAAPIDQEPSQVVGGGVAVGMADDGNAIAIWARATVNGDVLWANHYTVGAGWGTAVQIKTDADTDARRSRLDVGASGDAFVIWIQNADGRDDIWGVRYSGSSWGTPERIDEYDGADKGQPDIAIDGTGVAYAVWRQDDPDFANIWANQYAPESGWGTPQLIEPPEDDPRDDGDAQFPRVDVNSAGNAFVVWIRVWEGWRSAWSNRLDPGTSWVGAEIIEDRMRDAQEPKIAVDEDRHAHAAWLHDTNISIRWVRTSRFE